MRENNTPHHFPDNKLTTGQRTVVDINTELIKLQASHKNANQRRDEARKELASERNRQQLQTWAMVHLARRQKDYKEQVDKIHTEIVALRSHMPMLGENCILPSPICSLCCNGQATVNEKNPVCFSSLSLPEEGCLRCLPGWIFISPKCYYLPFAESAIRKTWREARRFCQRYKSDLAVIDSVAKNVRYISKH